MANLGVKKVALLLVAGFWLFGIARTPAYKEYMSDISVRYNSLAWDDKLEYKKLCKLVDAGQDFELQRNAMLSDDDYWQLLNILVNEDYRYFYVRNLKYSIAEGTVNVLYDVDMSSDEITAHLNGYETLVKQVTDETADLTDLAAFEVYYNKVQESDYKETGGNVNTAIGCLVEKKSNCQGNAKALRQLCIKHKIPCILLCGTYEGVNHMWNMVYLDNKWYYSDPTNGATPLFDELTDEYIVF